MHDNKVLPIIVGGTSYWIQHLMFPDRLVSQDFDPREQTWSLELEKSIASLPVELLDILQNLPQEPPSAKTHPDQAFRLYSLLSILDPLISQRWHWKDTRKVLRCLEIIKGTRKRPSEIIQEQSSTAAEHKTRYVSSPVGKITGEPTYVRYRTLSFWLYAELSELRPRLDARVDSMILVRWDGLKLLNMTSLFQQQGLVDEVRWMRELAVRKSLEEAAFDSSKSMGYTLGIYQSIG